MPCKPVSKLTIRCALLALTLGASGCSSGRQILDGCAGWSAIRPTSRDIAVMSDELTGQVLTHNETGAARGCWPRPTLKR
ncbi:hypothetical protein GCM10011497_06360 [Elstera cyanobacteriorum]|nr:hypothetical protein GCM10011497_06360 [Elstera cyanobacteriorum]